MVMVLDGRRSCPSGGCSARVSTESRRAERVGGVVDARLTQRTFRRLVCSSRHYLLGKGWRGEALLTSANQMFAATPFPVPPPTPPQTETHPNPHPLPHQSSLRSPVRVPCLHPPRAIRVVRVGLMKVIRIVRVIQESRIMTVSISHTTNRTQPH